MIVARRCIVRGRVQGVAYRAYARQRAKELGLRGYAKNLDDGDVEVLACGAEHDVVALCEWLWRGSPHCEVEDVQCEEGVFPLSEEFLVM